MNPSLEYIAGFFDGEGCVHMSRTPRARTYRLCVEITSSYPALLRHLQDRFGGRIHPVKRCVNKQLYQWRLIEKDLCASFLEAIQPFAIEKRPQIEIALEWLPKEAPRRGGWPRGPSAGYDVSEAERCCAILRDLKRVSYPQE